MRAPFLILLVAACGGGGSATETPAPSRPEPRAAELPRSAAGIDRAVFEKEADRMEALAQRSCACADPACMQSVDDEVGAYYRGATMNDPHADDVEVWPTDLDERLHVAQRFHYECLARAKVTPYSLVELVIGRYARFRDAICACTDTACVKNLITNLEKRRARGPFEPREAQREELGRTFRELQTCTERITDPALDEALVEFKAVRKRACECADKACAEQAAVDGLAWAKANGWMRTTNQQRNDEMKQLGAAFAQCLKALGVDPPHVSTERREAPPAE